MSPSASSRGPGMPCTISSFTETQSTAGIRRQPVRPVAQERRLRRRARRSPCARLDRARAVVTPGFAQLAQLEQDLADVARGLAHLVELAPRLDRGCARRRPSRRERSLDARARPRRSSPTPSSSTSTPLRAVVGRSAAAVCVAVDPHAVADRRLVVVRATLDLGALAGAAATSSSSSTCERDAALERACPSFASIASSASACAGVRGKPSSTKPCFASGCASRSSHDPDHDLVGDELAAVHERLGLAPDRRPRLHRRAQHVAGRDLRDAELLDQALGLRALARRPEARAAASRRALIVRASRACARPSRSPRTARDTRCASIWPIVSSATPTTISSAVPPK